MPNSMRAIVLERSGSPLVETRLPVPVPGPGQVLVRVRCSGVCRTDLHVLDGELAHPKLPLVLGHQVVGTVEALGPRVDNLTLGQRVGVPWLGRTCGDCHFCQAGRENLCEGACFTGYDFDGGFAEYMTADSRFVLPLPGSFVDVQAAPLLCAGLIGYRALAMTGDAARVGLFGFGSAAHIVAQVALYQGRRAYAFTRRGDGAAQAFARGLGCAWAGASDEDPPERLDAAIVFAPDGALVPRALGLVERGGTVVCAGIHMSAIPSFAYELLWGERSVRSVANLTRRDGVEFLELAPRVPIRTEVRVYPLSGAAMALADLRAGAFRGAAVVVVDRGAPRPP
jgi:propanol-preferring alcohol dehydrogenase